MRIGDWSSDVCSSDLADTGLVGIYLATARKQAGRALDLTRKVLEQTADELPPAELERAKAQATAGLLMGLESVQERCAHLDRTLMLCGRPVDAAETGAAIDRRPLAPVVLEGADEGQSGYSRELRG